jgi:large subunit ribosomal protein L25
VLHTDAGFNVLIDLHVDGEQHLAMPKEVQRDIVRGEFLHADFIKISRTEKIQVNIPIEITGSEDAPGVKEGGVVEHHLWELSIECLPTDVPSSISADISALEINDALHVSDLTAPENVTILTPEEETVVAVIPAPIMKVETEEALEAEAAAAAAAEAGEGVEGEGEEGEGGAGGEAGGGDSGDSGGGDPSGDDES